MTRLYAPKSSTAQPARQSDDDRYTVRLKPITPDQVDAIIAANERPRTPGGDRDPGALFWGLPGGMTQFESPGRIGPTGVATPATPEEIRAEMAQLRAELVALGAIPAAEQESGAPAARELNAHFLRVEAQIDLLPPGREQDTLRESENTLYKEALPYLGGFLTISTGIPLVDDGLLCGRPGNERMPECFLDEKRRLELHRSLEIGVLTAMSNFCNAITKVRIDLLTTSEHGWNFLAEFLFFSITGPLIKLVTGAITRQLANHLTEPTMKKLTDFKVVESVLQNASKGVRSEIKAAWSGIGHDARGKAEFLSIIQSSAKPLADSILMDSMEITDVGLNALALGYKDHAAHSLPAYEAEVRAMLERYDNSRIGDIGTGRSNGADLMSKKEFVKVKCGRHTRWAIVEKFDEAYAGPMPIKFVDGKVVPWGQTQFVSWVDKEFRSMAFEIQDARVGKTGVLDASQPTGIKAIDEWAIANGQGVTVTPIERNPGMTVTPIDEQTK